MNPERIKREFYRIKELGYLRNVKSDYNDGAAGNTFEMHLGVKENNLKEADFDNFEVKTKKTYLKSKSPISLFTLKPSFPDDGDNYMRNNWGVPDTKYPNILRFSTSLYGHRWSTVYKKFKYKIDVDDNQERIYLVRADLNENIIDKTIYWTFTDILKGAKKLQNMFLVDADMKIIDGKHHFKYTGATICLDYIGNTNFIHLIKKGIVRYDNRLGVHGPNQPNAGQPHNHGGGFRVNKKDIGKLYSTVFDLD
jgi:hypothetical protein